MSKWERFKNLDEARARYKELNNTEGIKLLSLPPEYTVGFQFGEAHYTITYKVNQ